jgi:tetratricopeptide (TPR) repeat protein
LRENGEDLDELWHNLISIVPGLGSLAVRFDARSVAAAELAEQVAEIAQSVGDLPSALDLYELALPLRIGIHGVEHSRVADVRVGYSTALWRVGDQAAAREQVTAALEVFERVLGADDLRTADAAQQLGNILQRAGEPDAALPLLRRAVDAYRARLGPLSPALATPIQNLGTLLTDLGRYEDAITELELGVALAEIGPPSLLLALTWDNLGVALQVSWQLPGDASNGPCTSTRLHLASRRRWTCR